MGGAGAIGAQHRLVEGTAGPYRHAYRAVLVDRRGGRATVGCANPTNLAAGGSHQHRGFRPARAPGLCRGGRAGHLDLDDRQSRRVRLHDVGDARSAGDEHLACAVGPHTGGDGRTFGAQRGRVGARPQHPHRPAVLIGEPAGPESDVWSGHL